MKKIQKLKIIEQKLSKLTNKQNVSFDTQDKLCEYFGFAKNRVNKSLLKLIVTNNYGIYTLNKLTLEQLIEIALKK